MSPTVRRRTWIVLAAILIPVLAIGGFAVWFTQRDSGPDEFALADGATFTAVSTSDLAGTWSTTDGSEAGYRIDEKLQWLSFESEAVGRTTEVTGELTVADNSGAVVISDVSIEVDVSKIESTDARRDRYMKTLGLQTDTYPTATFTADGPIDVPDGATEGETVEIDVPGELTLHGTTNDVTIPMQARLNDGQIEVVGSYELTMADYEIPELPFGNAIAVDPQGTLEFHLYFAKDGAALSTAAQTTGSTKVVVVLAETSLTGAFTEIEKAYEAANPGVDVQIRFDNAETISQLAATDGADVIALDSDSLMDELQQADTIETPEAIGTTGLVLVVSPTDTTITSVSSLNSVDPTKIGICDAQYPCGQYSTELLTKNAVTVTPAYTPPFTEADTGNTSGLQMITPVVYGFTTVDLAYIPDVKAAGSVVKGVTIPDAQNVKIPYSMATVVKAPNPSGGASFLAFVRSSEGQAALTAAGITAS